MPTTQHQVPIQDADGNAATATYSIRGLEENEIGPWATFCAAIFAYKPNPPSPGYFERHFYNDPQRDASLVRVAVDETDGAIVASCRVFVRQVSLGANANAPVLAGGIGEVCTHEGHRRRGLSKVLLKDAMAIMESRKMPLSLLHAAPNFFPVYESVGYACVPSKWSVLNIDMTETESDGGTKIRPASFPQDTEQLHKLHVAYSESKFAGCIVRSKEYWNDYISKELEGSLFVLADSSEEDIVAWASVRQRGPPGQYQLREFGMDTNKSVPIGDALSQLARHGIRKLTDEDENQEMSYKLSLPTAVLDEVRASGPNSFFDLDSVVPNDDNGWMYKTLLPDSVTMSDITGTVEDATSSFVPHIIWPADSF